MTIKKPSRIRFSDAEAEAILAGLANGLSIRRTAKKWGCSENTLRGMRAGKTYKWLNRWWEKGTKAGEK